jgi:DNA-binding XRE family transcriptional regulator
MIERNESKSGMHESMGPTVPKIKANVSHDMVGGIGHSVPMPKNDENVAESEWREAFRQRIRYAQGKRTQATMAKLLDISRDTYAKYVGGRGSVMSPRLLLKFCNICDVKIEWLIEGPQPEELEKPVKTTAKPPKIAARR